MKERIFSEAYYIIKHQATIRATAQKFGMSKTKLHDDMSKFLPIENYPLSREVQKVFDFNKSVAHLRVGMATKKKYAK